MKREAFELNYEFELTHWWFRARRDILIDEINYHQARPGFPSHPKILDYGCGTGGLTQSLEPFGEVFGVDEYQEAVDFCLQRNMKNINQIHSIEEIPSSSYDIITCFDVLEHIEDDALIIKNFIRILKEKGWLFLTVPALNLLWSGEDVVSQHKRRYRKNEIKDILLQNNFDILKLSYMNSFLFPVIAPLRMWNRYFRPSTLNRSDVYDVPSFLNEILYHIFALEKYILRYWNFPMGVSLLVIARK